jgi:hypothetical protein
MDVTWKFLACVDGAAPDATTFTRLTECNEQQRNAYRDGYC